MPCRRVLQLSTYMIMSTFVRPLPRDALEAINVELTQEGREIFHLVVLGNQPLGEFLGLVDAEGPAMWPP